ncbi:MAG: hypothetical protein AAGA92_11800 [Planctomycetota bacterium]
MSSINFTAGSTGATAAQIAAEEQRRQHEEEEEMTPYSPEDLNDDWEFKILRSATSAFKKPEKLREVLDEEARAGWMLVEKFDDQRVRLKRPASARSNDRSLGFDPYRTQVGVSGAAVAITIVCGILAAIIAVVIAVEMVKG